jgi:hypothetical protein
MIKQVEYNMPNISMNVNIKPDAILKKTKQMRKDLGNLPKEAYQFFRDITPIAKGNARNNTKLQGNKIVGEYPYASVLDKGRHMTNRGARGSTQAPKGMTQPTVQFIKDRVNKIVGK